MSKQQTHPIVVPLDQWYVPDNQRILSKDKDWFTQLEWMMYRKDKRMIEEDNIERYATLENLEKYYVINDLDIRKIQEQEAAGNYFLMSLYVNTMVFDKAAL